MIAPDAMQDILDKSRKAKESAAAYPKERFAYPAVKRFLSGRVFVGIAGLRGAGKTVLLRQLASHTPGSAYVSMDALPADVRLYELAEQLHSAHGIGHLFVDEIHAYPEWKADLKKAFDFLDVKIAFTSSSAIEIAESRHDLSRRVAIVNLPPFSFREYLLFKKGVELPVLTLGNILADWKKNYLKVQEYEPLFMEFCTGGALPFSLENPDPQAVGNVIDKIIQRDLPSVSKFDSEDAANTRRMLLFIARSGIEVCSYSSIAKNLGITKYMAQRYVDMLSSAFVLGAILPHGTNLTREPKFLFTLPFRAHLSSGVDEARLKGALREEFFAHHVPGLLYVKGAKGQKAPDYFVQLGARRLVFEIGGAGKGATQLKGVDEKYEKFVLSSPASDKGIPLVLFGFLY